MIKCSRNGLHYTTGAQWRQERSNFPPCFSLLEPHSLFTPLHEKLLMGFRWAKFTQTNTNRQKKFLLTIGLRGHHRRALSEPPRKPKASIHQAHSKCAYPVRVFVVLVPSLSLSLCLSLSLSLTLPLSLSLSLSLSPSSQQSKYVSWHSIAPVPQVLVTYAHTWFVSVCLVLTLQQFGEGRCSTMKEFRPWWMIQIFSFKTRLFWTQTCFFFLLLYYFKKKLSRDISNLLSFTSRAKPNVFSTAL